MEVTGSCPHTWKMKEGGTRLSGEIGPPRDCTAEKSMSEGPHF